MELFEENDPAVFEALPDLSELFELSIDAYYAALFAQMSELPIQKEISRFVEKVKKAGGSFTKGTSGEKIGDARIGEDRAAAVKAATDRGDPDVMAVLKAAGKAGHEIHRLTGFLRFSPDSNGVFTARCAPDHFVLPALAEHFTLRFGETSWAIIDEKRGLCLYREKGGEARLISWSPEKASGPVPSSLPEADSEKKQADSWEDLWRLYHRSINNEGRKNLRLQQQLMPERYRKYLTELS